MTPHSWPYRLSSGGSARAGVVMNDSFPGTVYCFNPERDEPELVTGNGPPIDELPLIDFPERLVIYDAAEDGAEVQAWRVWLLDGGATFDAIPVAEQQVALALRRTGRAILLMSADADAVARVCDGLDELCDAEHRKLAGWTAGVA